MSPASRSKSKDKKGGKEPPKAASKPSSVNAGATTPTSGYNPLLGTFHTIETAPVTSNAALHVNGRFRNIDETDDPSGHSLGPSSEYDSVSLNGSWSGESEDHKEKMSNPPPRAETVVPGSDNDKREKIRQKNEKKHQRQKERRAQELHEKCSGYLMSRKLEALAQQLVAMGFSSERATMALILNEGRVEESVSWLFEGGEEADKLKEHNLDGGGNLKIDISEELARITDMENKYKCSKQEVERALVACEGDLEKAEETLRSQKQEAHSASSKPEESGDPPTLGNGSSAENGSKSIQSLKRVQPKLEWAKPPQMAAPAEKRWQNAGSNPSVSYSLASPLQASTLSSKTEARYITVGNELKNLQLGTVREPVMVMQRPNQSFNPKQIPTSTVSSSPPGSTAGWVPYTVETVKANGLMPHIPGTRSLSPNGVSTNQLYSQLQYQQHQQPQQFVSSSGPVELPGTSRGNNLWSRTGALQTQTLSAASSLGLFSGLGTSGLSGSSSPVDWNSGGGSMEQLDYTNIDWSLDPEASSGGSREWASPFEERDLFSAPRQFVSSPSL